MKYFFFFCFVLLLGGALVPKNVLALDVQGVSVEPVFQEISFEAQATQVEFFVTLKNNTDQAVVFRPSVVDFGSLDESGGVAFLGETKDLERKYSLASWMRPEKDVVFLDAGETEKLRVVIENRDSLTPGGHYGALLFKVGGENENVSVENTVAVNQLISVLVFAKKKGGEIYDLGLKEKTWSKNLLFLPTQIKLRFQNAGNVHVVPRGLVTLTDPMGRVVAKGVINPESTLILPETLRTYTTDLRNLVWAIFPGKYELSIAYRYDGKEGFVTEKQSTFIFPWSNILFLIAIASIFWWKRSLLKKRSLEEVKK